MVLIPVRCPQCHSDQVIKSIQMHDIVIGLFVNRYEFGASV